MFKNYSGYLPEFVLLQKDERFEIVSFRRLPIHLRAAVIKHEKMAHNVDTKPYYKRIVMDSVSIMKFGGSYDPASFKFVCERATGLGYKVAPLFRDIHGGGQGALGWGVVHISKHDHVGAVLAELGIADEMYALSKPKFLNRINKLLGVHDSIMYKPSVRVIPDIPEFQGLAFASPEWMERNNIAYGMKLTGPVKSLVVPKPDHISFNADLVIMQSENKLKLSEEKLSRLISLVRSNTPKLKFSRNLPKMNGNLGRLPVSGFDMQALLNKTPNPDLTQEKDFYENGNLSPELFSAMFEYTDKSGDKKVRREGQQIQTGADPFCEQLFSATMSALRTVVTAKLKGRIPGIYGVAMPISLLPKGVPVKRGWVTRWPWMFPILANYAIYEHCIFVDTKLHKMFGGDYDGDLVAVYHRNAMDTGMVFPRDKVKLAAWMKAPEKVEDSTDCSINDTIVSLLEQYSGCGRVYNNCKVVVEAARMDGWDRDRLLELDARLYATIVQPAIDGFKNKGTDVLPSVKDIAVANGVPTANLKHVSTCFIAVRSRAGGITEMVDTAKVLKADIHSKCFYERVCALFKGWKLRVK